jgi:hypothetical protein
MNPIEMSCQCACGAQEFHLRLKRDEQVGLLTCTADHHSLLLDTRDYWADLLREGRPPQRRCGCGSTVFRVRLEYELRTSGEVRTVSIKPTCARCGRAQRVMIVEIKYSPTEQLIERPLDPIELPWLRPKRREVTALWLPIDTERFAQYLVQSRAARVFTRSDGLEFVECRIEEVQFVPELKRDLLFTNLTTVAAATVREPHRDGPFLRLSSPYHVSYCLPLENSHLLHYIQYSREVVIRGRLETQPPSFLEFAEEARDWLAGNYVSLRGPHTADNLQEYLRAKPHLEQRSTS